ncbi:MAG: hypothetical protein NT069_34425, partial [Planctomycetota bacterium]|nr:hypothetical protein [Planctomycetota bacterium]
MKRRIGNGCSRDDEVKHRVTFTDLTAGCAVGRDAAERRRDKVAEGWGHPQTDIMILAILSLDTHEWPVFRHPVTRWQTGGMKRGEMGMIVNVPRKANSRQPASALSRHASREYFPEPSSPAISPRNRNRLSGSRPFGAAKPDRVAWLVPLELFAETEQRRVVP